MRIRTTVSTAIITSALCLVGAGTAQAATPWAERIVRHTNVDGHTASTTLKPLAQATTIATYVTGSAFGACFHEDPLTGKPLARAGSEQKLGTYSTAPASTSVRAGATKAEVTIETSAITQAHPGLPAARITCRVGEYARWSGLHATRVTTSRYALTSAGKQGALLGTYTGIVDASLQL